MFQIVSRHDDFPRRRLLLNQFFVSVLIVSSIPKPRSRTILKNVKHIIIIAALKFFVVNDKTRKIGMKNNRFR